MAFVRGRAIALALSASLAAGPTAPALAGPCAPDGLAADWGHVPFTELAQGLSLIAGLEEPRLITAKSRTESAALATQLGDPEAASAIQQADLTTQILAAVVDGARSSSGYGLHITDLRRRGETMRLTVARSTPAPGQMTSSVISWPYALVAIPRASVPPEALRERRPRWIVCSVEGALLVEHSDAAGR